MPTCTSILPYVAQVAGSRRFNYQNPPFRIECWSYFNQIVEHCTKSIEKLEIEPTTDSFATKTIKYQASENYTQRTKMPPSSPPQGGRYFEATPHWSNLHAPDSNLSFAIFSPTRTIPHIPHYETHKSRVKLTQDGGISPGSAKAI